MTVHSMMLAIRDVLRSDSTNLPSPPFSLTNRGVYVGTVRDDASKGPFVEISYTGLGKSKKLNYGRATYVEDKAPVIRIQLMVVDGKIGSTYTSGSVTYSNDSFCLYFIEKIKNSIEINQTTLATNGLRSIKWRNQPEEPRQKGKWWTQNLFAVVQE